jgi:hypothetical protein
MSRNEPMSVLDHPELLRCPFCGDVAVMYKHDLWGYAVECDRENCATSPSTDHWDEMGAAASAWNKRA